METQKEEQKSDTFVIESELPEMTEPVAEKKKRGRPKKDKKEDKKVEIESFDFQIPISFFLISITNYIAERTQKEKLKMNAEEAKQIEIAFNFWCEKRMPTMLEKYYPEFVLISAFLPYFTRIIL